MIPFAAFAAAPAIAFASPLLPVSARSDSVARYAAAATPATPIAARSIVPSDLIVITAATPVTANPDAGCANFAYVAAALGAHGADRRVVRERGCRFVGRGVGVREAATDRAACAHLEVAHLARGIGERGELRADRLVVRDLSVSRERADHDRPVGFGANFPERRDATEIDERLGLRESELHEGQEAVAARDHFRVAAFTELLDGIFDRRRRLIGERVRDHRRPSPAARIARQIFSDVSGMSMCLTPSGESASMTALTAAGVEPMVPASPMPFTPRGFVFVSVTV